MADELFPGDVGDDEDILFADDDDDADDPAAGGGHDRPWKVLLVDDEPAVHDVTRLALDSFTFEGQRLEFLSAHSGREGQALLAAHPDIAVVLLDVVMEHDHAGLETARWIRQNLGNAAVRIVLRTGQPGQAPETAVIADYDINDYKEKTELTSQKLFTLMYSCLRSYRDITALAAAKRGLERVVEATTNILGLRRMQEFTAGVLTQVTSLMHLEDSAAYIRTDGLAATHGHDGYRVVAGIGEFAPLAAADGAGLAADVVAELDAAVAEGENRYTHNRFTSYFRSAQGAENLIHVVGAVPIAPLDRSLLDLFTRNVSIAYENIELQHEVEETQREIVYILGEAVETRSRETGNHVKRVAEITKLLALAYGLPEEEAEILRLASPLHDVGKIGIPDAILNKPGKLTPDEWEIMKTHAMAGYDMLKSSRRRILQAGALLARDHHERWEGGGYPFGKAGQDIHLYGRITAVADVFDALGNARCYKPAWPLDKVIGLLREEQGRQFEPRLVDLLVDNLDHIQAICARFQDAHPAAA
ncbi:MAG: DUF3369 domain-containing protein [Caenispirillum bisanense]|nr:DUF3369 domain-containing protein [Caenispirillum bisanense]MCA1972796.1 DUF3369 domain-containing protein [Caenispirillum sp.]